MDDNTPVIIGVGEASERIDSPDYAALSPADLAGRAAAAALDDAASASTLAPHLQLIAAIRQFEVSGPKAVAPFGKADNFPRAIARRIGADPARAILEPVGGQGPQHLVNELAQAIGAGQLDLALICGSEAISTVRHLTSKGETRDWSETVGGELEDRGFGEGLLTADLARHGARTPISVYAMFENARRARLGLSRADYGLEMGRLFEPFTRIAAGNPHAMSREVHTAESLATVTAVQPPDIRSRFRVASWPATRPTRAQRCVIASAGTGAELWGCRRTGFDLPATAGPTCASVRRWSAPTCPSSPASVLAARQALDVAGVSDGRPDRPFRLLQLLPDRRVQCP